MNKIYKNLFLLFTMIVSLVIIFFSLSNAKDSVNNNELNLSSQSESNFQNQLSENFKPNNNSSQPVSQINSNNFKNLSIMYIVIIIASSILFSLSTSYIILNIKNPKVFVNTDKVTLYCLLSAVITLSLSYISIYYANNYLLKINDNNMSIPVESKDEKDEIEFDSTTEITDTEINLNSYSTDLKISSGGSYTLSGILNHSIIVDSNNNDDVELNLNGVTINSDKTATILCKSASTLRINLQENSINTLSDSGNSEYDACIFSNAPLIIGGNGKLIVNGNQNDGEGIATENNDITINSGNIIVTSNDDGINAGGDNGGTITINEGNIYINAGGDGIDSNNNAVINGGNIFVIGSQDGGNAGIDTDNGYSINGGTVIALGTDMLETPLENSKQKSISFNFDSYINENTIVSLLDSSDNEIISFMSDKKFKTLIISSDKLQNNDYYLYAGGSHTGNLINGIYYNGSYTKGEKISINNINKFNISKIINHFGISKNNQGGK